MTTERILNWLANSDNTGESSKSLAFAALGVKQRYISYPHDPSDLNRCLVLMETAPEEVRAGLKRLAEKNTHWKCLFENWEELDRVFCMEVGWTPGKGWKDRLKSASDTWAFMKAIYSDAANDHNPGEVK